MATATVTSNGRITIPINVRMALDLKAGDRIDFVLDDSGKAMLIPVTKDVPSLKGIIPKPDRAITIEEML